MKSVLSPFRKNDTDRKKSAAGVSDEFEWDASKPTATAWSTAAHTKRVFRGAFGSKGKGGGISFFKKATAKPSTPSVVNRAPVSPGQVFCDLSPDSSLPTPQKAIIRSDALRERSQDLENLLNPPPRRRLSHRSGSMSCLPPTKPLKTSPSHSSFLCQSSAITLTTEESNGLNEFFDSSMKPMRKDTLDVERDRKKYRTKRLSIEGAVAPLSIVASSSFSHLAASAQDWKQIEKTTPPKPEDSMALAGSPARSVASSRKRGVGGSPLFSDFDDMSSQSCPSASRSSSSTSARPIRSRSRIFSPEGPAAPPMPFALSSIENLTCMHLASPNNNKSERGVMDIDSDHESDEASENDSPDSSFECDQSMSLHHEFEVAQHVETEHDVLQSMSSYPHLKFLIKTLRLEAQRVNVAFGEKTWAVVPKSSWHSSARAAFLQWATQKLGFSVRAAGGSVTYLQISKQKGIDVLEKLEKALKVYKHVENEDNSAGVVVGPTVPESFKLVDCMGTGGQRPSMVQRRRQSSMSPSPLMSSRPSFGRDDIAALDLASQLQNLSVNDRPPRSSDASAHSSLVRTVTLEPSVSTITSAPRSSFEHGVGNSRDIMFHLHGRDFEDEIPYQRPPRNSGASILSVNTYNSHRSSAPFPTIGAAQSFDCIETPCMNGGENWGSCPFQGRDWGESERCESITLDKLLVRFEESIQQAGMERISDQSGLGMSSNLNSDFDMEYEPEGTIGQKIADVPEEGPVVRFDCDNSTPEPIMDGKVIRKRRKSIAKLKRISLCYQLAMPMETKLSQFQAASLFANLSPYKIDEIRERLTSDDSVEAPSFVKEIIPFSWEHRKVPLEKVFSFLTEAELHMTTSLVSRAWADAAAIAHASLMASSIAYLLHVEDDEDDEDCSMDGSTRVLSMDSLARSMERPWTYLANTFPWGMYLAEGGMKKVYKVYNSRVGAEEAIAVMDVEHIREKAMISAELAISSLLSDLARRGVCPNFVLTRGVFNCPHKPPENHWGTESNKAPKGTVYDAEKNDRTPREPKQGCPGRYHYLRMELCDNGDAEEYIKAQPNATVSSELAQSLLFQTAFALHAAADRCSMKHYDIKLLNLFLQSVPVAASNGCGDVVLRYGLGSHVFALKMQAEKAFFAKLADYGTANVKPESNGQPVTIGQFTTIENTPPDYFILGDKAIQGHGHDNWGLGLVMFHLFTGEAPYEELLEEVVCPPALKKRLRKIWEDGDVDGYEVIRSVILSDVELDEAGHIVDGEPDETPYDTLYRALVLFGVPDEKFRQKDCPQVWDAISETLLSGPKHKKTGGRALKGRKKNGADASQYSYDCRRFSVRTGTHKAIARARAVLESMDGGLDLLFGLCNFNPVKRLSAMDVMNSTFMAPLIEDAGTDYHKDVAVHSFTAFSTHC